MAAFSVAWIVPANAAEFSTSETPEALQALSIMQNACGETPGHAREQLPSVKSLLNRAGRRSVALASEPDREVAQTDVEATPTPYATILEGPSPSPTPVESLPPLQRTPIGPGVLAPPTVPPSGATPAPPPTPSPSPTPSGPPTGPLPVIRPSGAPPTVAPKGAATATPFPTTSPAASPEPSP